MIPTISNMVSDMAKCECATFNTVAAIADDVIRELVNREVACICDGDD